MARFQNDGVEYVRDHMTEVEDNPVEENQQQLQNDSDSDVEDDMGMNESKTDTSAIEARNGKDIQGIPWERMNFTRNKYRERRLKQYRNYENLSPYRGDLEKECKQVKRDGNYYDFHFNTRLVKSTIVHFQLRNLLWAASKHDVYLMQSYSIMHWSSLLRRGKEVMNVSGPIFPISKHPGSFARSVSRVQISTMAVKDNLMVAGGFHGELICKYLNYPGVAFCTKITDGENAITNAVDLYQASNGLPRLMTANNDAVVRVFDTESFASLSQFVFPWCVNNTSVSPDGKLFAVLGDNVNCLIADAQSGKVIESLKGHLDYSFASAWHPDGRILATGNQDTTCRLWDIRKLSQSLAVLEGRMRAIRGIKFSSDGRFMAMAEAADFVHIYDTQSEYERAQEIDLFGEIAGISFSPDTEAFFVAVADRTYGSLMEFNRKREKTGKLLQTSFLSCDSPSRANHFMKKVIVKGVRENVRDGRWVRGHGPGHNEDSKVGETKRGGEEETPRA